MTILWLLVGIATSLTAFAIIRQPRRAASVRRVVYWGTYDIGKPRTRILRRALRENGVEVLECHTNVWDGLEDKSTATGVATKARFAFRWILSYPFLVARYLACPRHDLVIVGYLGHLDVIIIWPFARLRGVPILWDAFLSLYNTVVEDRAMVKPSHLIARLLTAWEWSACRAAWLILLDTAAHAEYFVRRYRLDPSRVASAFVGAEPEAFPPRMAVSSQEFTVLFYGQFIPLHGIETIVHAAKLANDRAIRWVIIGKGQEESKIRRIVENESIQIEWIPWVPYPELIEWIGRADVCLGIFGSSTKAGMVIPNKVFQILAAGRPLITRDSPAIRELVADGAPGVRLVRADDPADLLRAVRFFQRTPLPKPLHQDLVERFRPATIGANLLEWVTQTAKVRE